MKNNFVRSMTINQYSDSAPTAELTLVLDDNIDIQDLANMNLEELFPGKVVVVCQHCGQWAARRTSCRYCGAPIK